MIVLIIGSGGREHALAKKIVSSSDVAKVIVAPGNPGMETLENVEISSLNPFEIIKKFTIDLVVVGPEKPLADGIVDRVKDMGVLIVGPTASAAMLESSKGFAKSFMNKYDIPTASFGFFGDPETANTYLDGLHPNKKVVVKADGLAAGKGVFICDNPLDAKESVNDIFSDDFIVKDSFVVIEEFMDGRELSLFALVSGETYTVLGTACDYKRLNSGDLGPNTGGMGSITPGAWPGKKILDKTIQEIVEPTLAGMVKEGSPYSGFLYFGLMIEKDSVKVVEYNVRLGDPETQIILPLIKEDLVPYLMAVARAEALARKSLHRYQQEAVHVVLTSGNYANTLGEPMKLGNEISLSDVPLDNIYFSGVKLNENRKLINSGGRVLGVTALGDSLAEARYQAYKWIDSIHFDGVYWRDDIGKE